MVRRRLQSLILATCLALGLATTAAGDNRDDLVAQQQKNDELLEQLRANLEGTSVELQETYLALEQTRMQLPGAEQELRRAEETLAGAERVQQQTADRLAVAEAELEGLRAKIAEAEEEIQRSQASLGELARTTYQNGTTISPLSWVLGAQSSDEFLTQYAAMDSAVRSQTAVLVDMNELEATSRNAEARQGAVLDRIAELKAQADAAVAEADAARDAAAAQRARIVELTQAQESLAANLEGQRDRIEAEQAEVKRSNDEIAATVAQIDEENRRKAEAERLARLEAQRAAEASRGDAAAPAAPAPAPAASVALGLPIDAPLYVTSPYGYRVYPITGGWFFHQGVDLRSACGNRQYAVAAGTVTSVRLEAGNGTHGNQVFINHGMINGSSYVSVYNHLSGFAVSKGQSVSKGQTIGYTGTTGASTGCHVHLEIWKNGKTIDPMSLPGY